MLLNSVNNRQVISIEQMRYMSDPRLATLCMLYMLYMLYEHQLPLELSQITGRKA
jgi:hypothetical protein